MSLPPIISAMLQPQFYPHEVKEPIQLIQTHISFVLLTGTYAYKVKKAVNFGFLDFSTLDLRHHFCHEEVRLNARLAPDLYIGVVGIKEDGMLEADIAEISDQIVEYAVKMYQFDQENLAINLFNRGAFTADHAIQIGKQLAEFHRTAQTNDYIASFGTAQALKAVADENYRHTAKYVGIAQTMEQLSATKDYTDRLFAQEHLFSDRLQQGKIRECHGDVHLKNICIFQNKVQIFDCIEFNEPFRNTDTLYDAAFLVMDLQFRGRYDLANIFLNTYLEQTNDYTGLTLLPLFCSMRAYIRAKVTSFLLDDPNIEPAVKEQARAEAEKYYRLAWQYTQTKQGKIIMMSGVSGSGKSTTAKELAIALDGIAIRSDVIRKHLAGIDVLTRGSETIYSPAMTQKTYQRLTELAILLAKTGLTVIVDAKYDRQAFRQALIDTAKSQHIPINIVFCQAELQELRSRLRQRAQQNLDVSDATEALLERQLAEFEDFTPSERQLILPELEMKAILS